MNDHSLGQVRELIELSKLKDKRLELAANENVLSNAANKLLASPAASRYYFPTTEDDLVNFPEFAATASNRIDAILDRAKESIMQMLGAQFVNLFPLSGIHAMLMVIVALTDPGDLVLSLAPNENGHFATQSVVKRLGRESAFLPRSQNGQIDMKKLSELAHGRQVKMVYIDMMTHLEPVSVDGVKEVLGEQATTVYDASHTFGLMLGGMFLDPYRRGFDVVCANTHKTFPGPHRGIITAKNKVFGEKIAEGVDGKFYSSVHTGSLYAMALTIFEMEMFANDYASRVVANAQQLSKSLVANSFRVGMCYDGSPTKNHQVHILYDDRQSAYLLLQCLLKNHIVAHLCYVKREGYVIRFGVQELTRRGMKEDEMRQIALLVARASNGDGVVRDVESLADKFQKVEFSFDELLK